MRTIVTCMLGCTLLLGTTFVTVPAGHAQEGAMVEGAGYTMFNTESIKGSDTSKEKIDYRFVNETTIEAVVPEAKAGMSFIIVVAGGGSAQSKPLLIQPK